MTLLDINQVNEILNLGRTAVGIVFAIAAAFWTINKMYLQGKYQTKTESIQAFERLQLEIHNNSVTTSKEISLQNEKLNRMEKDGEIFKERYNGDMNLLKEQMKNQTKIMEDISHKVNGIANIKVASIVEMLIDEEFKKRKM